MRYKQKAFILEYLKDFNATQAAIRAGYSRKSAYSIGQENLKKPEIRTAVDERMASRDEVIAGLTDIARGNIADLMDISPLGFTLDLMTKDADGNPIVNPKTKLIHKIRQKVTTFLGKRKDDEDREVVETEIELYSAHDALRDLGRVRAIFVDKTEFTGKDGTPIQVQYVNTPYPITDVSLSAGSDPSEPKEV
jgi:phage terminase small subunit